MAKGKRGELEHWGSLAFIVGILIALVLGLGASVSALSPQVQMWLGSLLVLLGLIVGFLNISHHEAHSFVYVGTALLVASWVATQLSTGNLSSVLWIGTTLNGLFGALVSFLVPAVLVASLRAVYVLARHP